MLSIITGTLIIIALMFSSGMLVDSNTGNKKKSAEKVIERTIQKYGINAAKREFQKIKSDMQQHHFSEKEFNGLGYNLINEAKLSEAVEVFKMVVILFPHSTNACDSLGEAYLYSGDMDKAISSYRKIIEIDHRNTSGEKMVENIEKECYKRKLSIQSMFRHAVKTGRLSVVQSWLKLDPAMLNKQSMDGETSLHLAAYSGNSDLVEFLIKKGAKLNIRNLLGQTAYNIAQKVNLIDVQQLLSKNGANQGPQVFPELFTQYLGQTVPGFKPDVFARGIVSTHRGVYASIVFSPDFKEACWTPNDVTKIQWRGGFITTRFENGRWTAPCEVRFMPEEYSHRSPFIPWTGNGYTSRLI